MEVVVCPKLAAQASKDKRSWARNVLACKYRIIVYSSTGASTENKPSPASDFIQILGFHQKISCFLAF